MKIVVCMKQVVDLAQLRFKGDGRTPVLEGLPMILSAFEKHALEEAVRIKEAQADVHVIALSAGSAKLKETIKEALAMGADEAALVNDPAILLADEPTGNLDSHHTHDIWRLLRRLASEQQRTIVVVTHEAAGAAYADRIVVLRDGRIVGEITPQGEDDASLVATRYTELAG